MKKTVKAWAVIRRDDRNLETKTNVNSKDAAIDMFDLMCRFSPSTHDIVPIAITYDDGRGRKR